MALQHQVISSDLSNGFVCYQLADDDDHDGPRRHAVINFKNNGSYNTSFSSESLLSFEKNDHDEPEAPLHKSHEMMMITNSYLLKTNNEDNICLSGDLNSFQQTSEGSQGSANYGWLYSDSTTLIAADSFPESDTQVEAAAAAAYQKRPNSGESTQPLKKQCTSDATGSTVKKPRAKSSSPSKDPQSIAAKNRRERISERLKILQELVPNGCKVDLVTMLEKAYSYVKFLQLQVKVLATDEFWPVQGGKAPDISQVKEAIDAILASSHRERSSSSKL